MDELIILVFAIFLTFLLRWGFKALPEEKWQILWTVPLSKRNDGSWRGVNFTYYGFFNALALVLATSVMVVAAGAVGVPRTAVLCVAFGVFAASMPSAKIVARLVEKKKGTFSVGAASFAGLVSAPWIVVVFERAAGFEVPVMPAVAALSISYAIGEGVGRLACVSFGCCYGKPLSDCGLLERKLFKKRHFIFTGKTKKIAYAHHMDGRAVLPIQAVTSVIYCASGVLGLVLFVNGFFRFAFLVALVVTQMWRFASEFYRSDHRGGGRISAYQKLSLAAVIYGVSVALIFPAPANLSTDLVAGLKTLWDPAVILFLQLAGAAVFVYMGRSGVTGAVLRFHVNQENI